MQPISPVICGLEPYEMKLGGPENNKPQFLTLPALRSPDGKVMSRWHLSDEERSAIMNGADIVVTIWTGGGCYPPTEVAVQKPEEGAEYYRQKLRLDDALALRMLSDDLQLAANVFHERQAAFQAKVKEIFPDAKPDITESGGSRG